MVVINFLFQLSLITMFSLKSYLPLLLFLSSFSVFFWNALRSPSFLFFLLGFKKKQNKIKNSSSSFPFPGHSLLHHEQCVCGLYSKKLRSSCVELGAIRNRNLGHTPRLWLVGQLTSCRELRNDLGLLSWLSTRMLLVRCGNYLLHLFQDAPGSLQQVSV